ncbi:MULTISPECIES: cytochrome c oxidase assembly protein [Rhodococcus]|uniref:Cytochrome c oxidase assembly protein n=1 Tax=Rhodococcus rhodochrous TaxID=1829 RepID=A0AAW4XA83_RHORH|nr:MULTISPECIES: cytochrome c oxidase assembly protein [Rhodococcus]MCD2109970.1 cytochrome c oxidase assembly protein [Rhodococcus rhodochrous]QHG84162.1 copper resistance protein CopD [Rhodococcus rhodochrous]QOH56094.1 copper resistance protein CopD [Rhodococcus rhodochrous]WAL48154.1 cytochrome c oxidase assembly protein [Rhodococcus pyridinivorans]
MATSELASPAQPPAPAPTRGNPPALLILLGLLAALVAAFAVGLSAAQALVLLGIPDPGPLTTYGLPAVRAISEIATVITIGSLFFAAFLVPPQRGGVLDVGGYRAVRTAGVAATVWAVTAALMVPLTLSDTSGSPLSEAIRPENLFSALGQVEAASAWAWTTVLALITALLIRLTVRWSWTPYLLLLSVVALMPIALTGHSSSGGSHDMATNSLVLHLVAASVWAGGLFALLAHSMRGGEHTDIAARRFSFVAGLAFVVMAVSGVINAAVRMSFDDLTTTTYGRLLLAKIVALVLLGIFGWAQRRRALPALEADPTSRSALVRFTLVEAFVLAATIGLAVGLGRTPPPPPATVPTIQEVELGYQLDVPPSFVSLFFGQWRFDLIFGTAALVLAAAYAVGLWTLRKRGDSWPIGRSIAWFSGCFVLFVATSSGVGMYSPAMFSVHMGAHMALSMLAPVLLALGGAMTLALRAFKPAGRNAPPGPREWILEFLHSPPSRFFTHPIVASVMFVGGFYALYLGGIFTTFIDSHTAHVLMNLHFLLSGYLFYWVVIGVDPSPRDLQPVTKLAMVFGSLPFHAFFGVTLMSMGTVMAESYYRGLALPWNYDLFSDQKVGGSIAWSAGEIPLVLVMLALLVQWSRSDRRTARRVDRAAERDDDADLAAHNAMFAELARRDHEGR